MVLLRYRRGALLGHAALVLSALVPFVLLFLNPGAIDPADGPFHRLLGSDFGRTFFIPAAIIAGRKRQ